MSNDSNTTDRQRSGSKTENAVPEKPNPATVSTEANAAAASAAMSANDRDQTALYELERQRAVLRDAVRDVAAKIHTSAYLYGATGTSKTFLVRSTLDNISEPYKYLAGHVTPMGYFDWLKENPDGTLVLDDATSLFHNKIGQQLLLASLGSGYGEERARVVRYHERNRTEVVNFTGGLIVISNEQLHDVGSMSAIKSRTRPILWNPSEAQLLALMRDATKNGWNRDQTSVSAVECHEVLDFLVAQCHHFNAVIECRLFFEGALPDFAASKAGQHETDWRDHTVSRIRERIGHLRYSGPPLTRDALKKLEQKIAEQVRASCNTRAEQVATWIRETGKSDRAYDRRIAELRIAK